MSAEDYLKARAEYEAVKTKVKELAQKIAHAAKKLETNPSAFTFTNVGGVAYSPATAGKDAFEMHGDLWPTARSIMLQLEEYHACRAKLVKIWSSIPKSFQEGFIPPKWD